MTCRRLVLMWALLLLALPVVGQEGRLQPAPNPAFIHGKLVDEQGTPLAGLRVAAASGDFGQVLPRAMSHGNFGDGDFSAVTGPDGTFIIAVPYNEVTYRLGIHYSEPYHLEGAMVSMPQGDGPAVLVAKQKRLENPIEAVVRTADGSPAMHLAVTLVAENGATWTQRTDARGHVEFNEIRSGYIGQCSLMARSEHGVIPLTIVRWRNNQPTEVTLAPAAMVTGVVRDKETGDPLPRTEVTVRPYFASGLSWTATSDDEGRFMVTGLPPGRYIYSAQNDTHADVPTQGDEYSNREIELAPGASATAEDFNMLQRATVRGRVIGPDGKPVAGAMVGCQAVSANHYDCIDVVYTDADGRFELRPGHFKYSHHGLEAFHPLAGGADLNFNDLQLEPGKVVEGVDLQLGGTVIIRGTVTDAQGNPLAGVLCSYPGPVTRTDRTDAQGRYDLGRVQLRDYEDNSPKLFQVMAMPPRPEDGFNVNGDEEDQTPAGPWYVADWAQPELDITGVITQDFALKQTEKLAFRGVVLEDDGRPMRDARVYLLAGRLNETVPADKQAIEQFINTRDRMNRQQLHRGGSYVVLEGMPPFLELAYFTTNATGAWGVRLLRTDTDPQTVSAIRNHYVWQTEPGEQPPPDKLEWVTVLAVWGVDGESHRLYPPIRITDEQATYVVEDE